MNLSERQVLGRLMSIFSSVTSLRSSLLSFHFAVCQLPHFAVKKHNSVPQPCTGAKFVNEKSSDETNTFDVSVAALCAFSCGKNLSRCAKGFCLWVLYIKIDFLVVNCKSITNESS